MTQESHPSSGPAAGVPFAGRAAGTRMVVLAYVVAGAVAVLTALALGERHPIAIAFWADVAATVAIFAFSFAFRNSSFYDAYWSVGPIAIALYWAFGVDDVGDTTRRVLVLAGVFAWGARLTFNWWRGWTGLDHEDWRYGNLQQSTGRAYWLVSFSGIHMFPTFQVFAGCLALWPALAVGARPLGWLDALAVVVTATAIALEAIADQQLVSFRRSRPGPDAVLQTGLWARSRHPNYLGEMLFWWGLWLFGLAAAPAWWWTGVGALAISVMFFVVSLPMIERRMLERRPAYAEVIERVPLLLPRLRS